MHVNLHHVVPRDACISPELAHSIVDFLVIMLDTQIDFFFIIAADEMISSWQWMLGLKEVKDQ